jgi:glucose-1-phosphate thymidylyltransferase
VLAGGSGSRLHPITHATSKQLLPVYDKPLVYYPLSVLMLAGIRDILLISTPVDLPAYGRLLGDGGWLGLSISYAEQTEPRGLADAFVVGRDFVGEDAVALVLGDNIFHGHRLAEVLQTEISELAGATLFGYPVGDPSRYGVVDAASDGTVRAIEEKPAHPPSNIAVTGLYLYDNDVLDIAAGLAPSARGELEITDVNNAYVARGAARLVNLGRGMAWLDTGTHDSLLAAAQYVQVLERRQGVRIACVEEVAFRMGWIGAEQLAHLGEAMGNSSYAGYLLDLAGALG